MKQLIDWLDERTGIRALTHSALYEHIPGGSRWRYVWGSTLVFAFAVQVITGVVLWSAYSPSSHTAWESVYYIQYEMAAGWLVRGLHHFMAQAMVVLLALHLMQVVIDGAYRAPREVNFWMGLVLMLIVLGLSLTGYLLPWDQKGFWATRVATNIAGISPGVGPYLQKVVVGGSDYGHHTLTRFFALHAGVLPGLLIGFLVLHLALFRKHGIHARLPYKRPHGHFWPDQVLKDAVACLAVLVTVLFFILRPAIFGPEAPAIRNAALSEPGILGADLGAPADRSNKYDAARPEWYFLFLFQGLKLFEFAGKYGEILGAIVTPTIVLLILAAMPLVGRWRLGHWFNVGFVCVLLIGVGALTGLALRDDYYARWVKVAPQHDPGLLKRYDLSRSYLEAVADAERESKRAIELARAPEGIPPAGLAEVMRSDPKTMGPRLFRSYCASCHTFNADPNSAPGGATAHGDVASDKPTGAPNLEGFGKRAWIEGLLDSKRIVGPDYFGHTKHRTGEMAGFVKDKLPEVVAKDPQAVKKIAAALSAEAMLRSQKAADERDAELIKAGRALITGDAGCTDCHKFHEQGDLGSGPDLTGYGSHEWLAGMIGNPAHERFYGDENDRMPTFVTDPKADEGNLLAQKDLGLLVDWLRGDWYEAAPGASAAKSASGESE